VDLLDPGAHSGMRAPLSLRGVLGLVVKDQKLVFGERQLRNRSAPGHLRTRLQKHPEPGV
jgi:hypothetical protein